MKGHAHKWPTPASNNRWYREAYRIDAPNSLPISSLRNPPAPGTINTDPGPLNGLSIIVAACRHSPCKRRCHSFPGCISRFSRRCLMSCQPNRTVRPKTSWLLGLNLVERAYTLQITVGISRRIILLCLPVGRPWLRLPCATRLHISGSCWNCPPPHGSQIALGSTRISITLHLSGDAATLHCADFSVARNCRPKL